MYVPSHPDNRIIVGMLTAATRLRNRRSGNARWLLVVGAHRYYTKLDTQIAASFSPEAHLNQMMYIEVDDFDRIVDIKQQELQFLKRCPSCDITFTYEDDWHDHNLLRHHLVTRPRDADV